MNPPKFTNHTFFINGVWSIEYDIFQDKRGFNFEGYNSKYIGGIPELDLKFNVDSFSASRKNTLRGFHGDSVNYKMVQCLFGEIQLVLIDKRKYSPTFNKILYFNTLSSDKPTSVVIPPGVVNAHLCLSEHCVFHYKLTKSYEQPSEQIHIKWNDPMYNITWFCETKDLILSERDE